MNLKSGVNTKGSNSEPQSGARTFSGSIRSFALSLALGLTITGLSAQTPNRVVDNALYISAQSNVAPTDFIQWESLGGEGSLLFNSTVWTTRGGNRFRVTKPASGSFRLQQVRGASNIELGVTTQNATILRIELEKPVKALGAEVILPIPRKAEVTLRAFDSLGNQILLSKELFVPNAGVSARYMGVLASEDVIRSIEVSVDSGSVALGHLDLRTQNGSPTARLSPSLNGTSTGPVVRDQNFSINKNGNSISPIPTVSMGTRNVEGYRLVKKPEHAEKFQFFEDGSFIYRPLKDYTGVDSFLYAGITESGKVLSLPAVATVNVLYVNSAPIFKGGTDIKVSQDAGSQVFPAWATEIGAGDMMETESQRMMWIVNNDNPTLFIEQPMVLPDGTLRFAAAPNTSGAAKVTVWLKDNGGTESGGVDTSRPYTFNVEVVPVVGRPQLDDIPEITLGEGETLSIRAKSRVRDAALVTVYSVIGAPRGMTIDPITGAIAWTPEASQIPGVYDVTIRAGLATDASIYDSKTLRINTLKHVAASGLRSIPLINARVGSPVLLYLEPIDRGAVLQYMLGSTGSTATLDSLTGEFKWMPKMEDSGRTRQFLVSGFDPKSGRTSSVMTITINVAPAAEARPIAVMQGAAPMKISSSKTTKKVSQSKRRRTHSRRHR